MPSRNLILLLRIQVRNIIHCHRRSSSVTPSLLVYLYWTLFTVDVLNVSGLPRSICSRKTHACRDHEMKLLSGLVTALAAATQTVASFLPGDTKALEPLHGQPMLPYCCRSMNEIDKPETIDVFDWVYGRNCTPSLFFLDPNFPAALAGQKGSTRGMRKHGREEN